jgi:hypothetical protein
MNAPDKTLAAVFAAQRRTPSDEVNLGAEKLCSNFFEARKGVLAECSVRRLTL